MNEQVALLAQALLPTVEKMPAYQALLKTRDAIGAGITKDQQVFVSANLGKVYEFIATPAGNDAISIFIDEWQKYENRKSSQKLS